MALIDRKVNDWSQAVSSLDDKPKMTAAALKAAFDSNSNQLKPAINGIIDDLTGSQGALNIGLTPIDGLSGSNVQAVLQAISMLIKSNDVDLASLERLFTADGASLVGLQPVSGVSSGNLQQAIISLADTISKVDPYLGNPVAISQGGTGAKDSQNALYNLGARPNKNLLDNWYFVGGGSQLGDDILPINQRGKDTYTSYGHSIDRWILGLQSTLKLEKNFIKISCNATSTGGYWVAFSQKIKELLLNTPKTISILVSEKVGQWGIGLMSDDDELNGFLPISSLGLNFFNIPIVNKSISKVQLVKTSNEENAYINIQGIKLNDGNVQTLARQLKDSTWELLEKPDYISELAKCERYLLDITPNIKFNASYTAVCTEAGALYTTIPLPVPMRITPTLLAETDSFQIALSDGSFPVPESVSIVTIGGNYIALMFIVSSAQIGQVADIRLTDETKKWLLSAEL